MWWAGLGSSCENQQAVNFASARRDTWVPLQLECTLCPVGLDRRVVWGLFLWFWFVIVVVTMFLLCLFLTGKLTENHPFHTGMDSLNLSQCKQSICVATSNKEENCIEGANQALSTRNAKTETYSIQCSGGQSLQKENPIPFYPPCSTT